METKFHSMKQQMIDNQYHSMKDNLTFYGLPEKKDEDTRAMLVGFLREVMKVPDTCFTINNLDTDNVIWIKRCHRYGQPSRNAWGQIDTLNNS